MTRNYEAGRKDSNPFIKELSEVMKLIQSWLGRHCPCEFGSPTYHSWISDIEKQYLDCKDNTSLRYCDHLKEYNKGKFLTRFSQGG